MKFGVVIYPGSNCEADVIHVLEKVMEQEVVRLWHKENECKNFKQGDCIVLPGGFSYGDYLRAGAIARFSPLMESVIKFAKGGGFVLGICNGFQILCEAGLLPGALLRNIHQKFICKNIYLRTMTTNTPLTRNIEDSEILKIPIAHAEGRYFADKQTLQELKANDQILFQYCDKAGNITQEANANGAMENIAGICNKSRNVFGMMPHPERASEEELGNTDGRVLFESLLA